LRRHRRRLRDDAFLHHIRAGNFAAKKIDGAAKTIVTLWKRRFEMPGDIADRHPMNRWFDDVPEQNRRDRRERYKVDDHARHGWKIQQIIRERRNDDRRDEQRQHQPNTVRHAKKSHLPADGFERVDECGWRHTGRYLLFVTCYSSWHASIFAAPARLY